MEICVVGLNHKTAPIEIREKLNIPNNRMGEFLKNLEKKQIFRERLILSTCNRTEIYGVGNSTLEEIERIKKSLAEYANLETAEFEDKLYAYQQPQSIEHLFCVASGLDSMVLGETEIIGQVKDAYFLAKDHGQTGKILNTLFQKSFKVAKDLRSQTQLGSGHVSVASLAVHLAEKIFESIKDRKLILLGTGQMASQVARVMVSKGARPIIVSGRNFERAAEMAIELEGALAVHHEDYQKHIREVDIVIASTLCTQPVIDKNQVTAWMKERHGRPLFMIDIAVPRNIDPLVQDVDNAYLYNIDDLTQICQTNRTYRQSQIDECSRLVHHQTKHFMDWLHKSSVFHGFAK